VAQKIERCSAPSPSYDLLPVVISHN